MLFKDDSCIAEQTIMRYQSNSIAELLGSDWYGILLRHPNGNTTIDTYFDVSHNIDSESILSFANSFVSDDFLHAGKGDIFEHEGSSYFVFPIRSTKKGYFVFFLFFRKDVEFGEKDIRWYKTYSQTAYQRVLLENELVQIRNYNGAILEDTDYAIVVIDKKYRIVSSNANGKLFFGGDSIRLDCFGDASSLTSAIENVFLYGEKQSVFQLWYHSPSGRTNDTLLNVSISPLRNSKNLVSGAVISAANVTNINVDAQTVAQKRYYKEIESIFLNYISEMRSPLMNISCCAKLLRESAVMGAEEQKLIEYIISETEKIEKTNKQMELFRFVNQDSNGSRFDLKTLLENCISLAGRFTGQKKVDINLHISEEIPLLSVDSGDLYIVFLNLIQSLILNVKTKGHITIECNYLNHFKQIQTILKIVADLPPKECEDGLDLITSGILSKYGATVSHKTKDNKEVIYEVIFPAI